MNHPGGLAGLQAELTRLRADLAARRRRRLGWRSPLAVVLILLGCVLMPLSVVGVWARRERGELVALRTGPVGGWIHANLTVLRIALGGIVFVFSDRPSVRDALVLVVVVSVALAVLEFVARPPRACADAGDG